MATITVSRQDAERFLVRVDDGDSRTEHDVTLSAADLRRLGEGYPAAEDLVRACFEFLLERENKESILRAFDVSVIGRYFPEFEATIARG